NAVLIGASVSMLFEVIKEKKKTSKTSFLQTFASLLFSAAATGCSVCSAFLLPLLGIAASLTALPFGGLEIKFLSALLLLYTIYEYAKITSGLCKIPKEKIVSFEKGQLEFKFKKETLPQLWPIALLIIFVLTVYTLPRLPKTWRLETQRKIMPTTADIKQGQSAGIFAQINPPEGYQIKTKYNDIGPMMLEMGVIDLEKFKQTYEKSGQPLTPEQLDILTKGSNKKIRITPDNSYFLLNFFWAFGLANQSKILTEGEMIKYGGIKGAGNFASTGGWSLTKSGDSMEYYAKRAIVPLTKEQEDLVNKVASGVYRPCCGNSTAFPDCNHGMALLGIFELMASQGATESEMFQAGKYINSYWFPGTAFDTALYFKNKEGKEFKDIDPKVYLGRNIFSAFGAQTVKKWLIDKGIQEKPPAQGGGCGV
ncbi:hypothetical protein HZA75_05775, partial [Candidatus Roizmanbacteria bacterium]|nr:hypothetical protein [Candidatus Roizmanbacteria bacterium]